MAAINELFTLSRFSNGRRIFVFKQVLKAAEPYENPAVTACAQEGLDGELEIRKLERRWRTERGTGTTARGRAKEIDVELDRLVSSMLSAAQSLLVPLDPKSDHAAKVRAFIATYFPEGAAAITGAEYEDALAILQDMNEDFAKLSADELGQLNITYHVRELAQLTPQFATELNRPTGGMRFETLSAARLEGHERLCELVATIVSQFRGKDPDKIDARNALLAPILDADARVAARRKRKNGPDVEVDPNTGEDLPPGHDLVDVTDAPGPGGGPSNA